MTTHTQCRQCNKPIKSSRKFCDRHCYALFQRSQTAENSNAWRGGSRIKLTCPECQTPFEIYPSQLKNKTTGVTRRFCGKACWYKARKRGWENPNWRGGRRVCSTRGYVLVWAPWHPKAVENCVYEHRLVMENHMGRQLETDEHVHHIDGNTSNNDIDNLQLLTSSEHSILHNELNRQRRNAAKTTESERLD